MKKKILCVCDEIHIPRYSTGCRPVRFGAPFNIEMSIPLKEFRHAPDYIVYSEKHFTEPLTLRQKWLKGLEYAQPYWQEVDMDDPESVVSGIKFRAIQRRGYQRYQVDDNCYIYCYDYRADDIVIYERHSEVDRFNRRTTQHKLIYSGDVQALLDKLEAEENKRKEWNDEYLTKLNNFVAVSIAHAKEIVSQMQTRECAILFDDDQIYEWKRTKLEQAIQETAKELGYE